MLRKRFLFGITAALLVFALAFTTCDDSSGDDGPTVTIRAEGDIWATAHVIEDANKITLSVVFDRETHKIARIIYRPSNDHTTTQAWRNRWAGNDNTTVSKSVTATGLLNYTHDNENELVPNVRLTVLFDHNGAIQAVHYDPNLEEKDGVEGNGNGNVTDHEESVAGWNNLRGRLAYQMTRGVNANALSQEEFKEDTNNEDIKITHITLNGVEGTIDIVTHATFTQNSFINAVINASKAYIEPDYTKWSDQLKNLWGEANLTSDDWDKVHAVVEEGGYLYPGSYQDFIKALEGMTARDASKLAKEYIVYDEENVRRISFAGPDGGLHGIVGLGTVAVTGATETARNFVSAVQKAAEKYVEDYLGGE